MKHEYKTILFLVMLTFLSVNCGSESDSGDEDEELSEFNPSESSETSDGMSIFDQLVEANEAGLKDADEESEDDSTVNEWDPRGQPVVLGEPL